MAEAQTTIPPCPLLDWWGCYADQWGDLIVSEAYQHPAKFAKGLIERIIGHGLKAGYWRAGDLLGDPFGGVALGGIVAAYHGLRWVGVELEEKFVRLGAENISLHTFRLKNLGAPLPVLLKGDSRRFAEIVARWSIDGAVTSPPYNLPMSQEHSGRRGGHRGTQQPKRGDFARYGDSAGQIEGLPDGHVDGAITSPPYTQGYQSGGGINVKGYGPDGADKVGQRTYQGRGAQRAAGNIETLPEGTVDGAITSPPYADSIKGDNAERETAAEGRAKRKTQGGGLGQGTRFGGYGRDPANIGALSEEPREDKKETYWQAMAAVYRSMLAAVKAGGVAAIVVKDYVKAGARVRLCDDTLRLLAALGAEPISRVRAMLVSRTAEPSLFGEPAKRKERKSFFRRLHESKLPADSDCRIDWEEVLFVRKGREVGGMEGETTCER